MRVALVHYALARGGGMESYLADLARGFRAAGDEVHVYARKVDPGLAGELGATAHRVAMPPLPRPWRNRAFAARIATLGLRGHYPLVIALSRSRGHHVAINGGTHPGFVAAMARAVGAHDRIETRLERAMLDGADAIVAHSALLAREIAVHYPELRTPAHVIYPPVDCHRFRWRGGDERAALRAGLGLQPPDVAFLFPSMDHARKGLAPLLEAFASAPPNARLLIAGRAPDIALPPRARALGYVADMPALYAAVDWTVLPSRYEPFGLVIAESLACGTPAIVGASAGVAELLDDADGIRLERLDAAAIAAALARAAAAVRRVAPDFIERRGLDLAVHVAALRRFAADAKR